MPSITLSDLIDRVYSRLEGNTVFYTQQEVEDAINEGIRVLNLVTGFLQATGTVTTVAGQSIYAVPSTVLIPTRVALGGRYLTRASLRKLGHAEPTWMRDTTSTVKHPVRDWAPVGVASFAIFPAEATAGKTITVTGVAEPVPLTELTHALQYPSEFADALEDYAAHVCAMKGGGVVSKAAMVAYQGFLGRMNELRRYKGKIAPQFRVQVEQER